MSESERVSEAVEQICATGCSQVRVVMAALAAGEEVAEAAGLSGAERHAVLVELQNIMAVYDAAGSCPVRFG